MCFRPKSQPSRCMRDDPSLVILLRTRPEVAKLIFISYDRYREVVGPISRAMTMQPVGVQLISFTWRNSELGLSTCYLFGNLGTRIHTLDHAVSTHFSGIEVLGM